jgi:DNA-binding NarL/FixJ family response regulator
MRFLGVADRVRDEIGIPRHEGVSGVEYQRARELASGRLGQTGLEAAWQAGHEAAPVTFQKHMAAFVERVMDRPAAQQAKPQPELSGLTNREMQVLRLLADGFSNQEIASALSIGHRTSATHVGNILDKLGLSSRTAAVAYALRNGLA